MWETLLPYTKSVGKSAHRRFGALSLDGDGRVALKSSVWGLSRVRNFTAARLEQLQQCAGMSNSWTLFTKGSTFAHFLSKMMQIRHLRVSETRVYYSIPLMVQGKTRKR